MTDNFTVFFLNFLLLIQCCCCSRCDGAARKIDSGKRKILFKKTAPKNLAAIGKISGLVIQALKEIGKDSVTDSEIQIILNLS